MFLNIWGVSFIDCLCRVVVVLKLFVDFACALLFVVDVVKLCCNSSRFVLFADLFFLLCLGWFRLFVQFADMFICLWMLKGCFCYLLLIV